MSGTSELKKELKSVEQTIASLYNTFSYLFKEDNTANQFWENLAQAKKNRALHVGSFDLSNIKKETLEIPFPFSVMIEHLNKIKQDVRDKTISLEGAICLALGIEYSLKERYQMLGIDEEKLKIFLDAGVQREDEIIEKLKNFANQYRLPWFSKPVE